jgi:hypothetical protein
MRDAKTVKKHMANQVAAQTSKSSYAAQWQDRYTQAKQRCKDDNTESDEEAPSPGLNGAQSGGSTEGLGPPQRPVKRRRVVNEGEIQVVCLRKYILLY